MLTPRAQAPCAAVPFHTWDLPEGSNWATFYRTPSGFLLRFPDLADFEVSVDGRCVTCSPAPDVPEATAEHLYLNQVLPLALSKLGKLVFHGSAVEIGTDSIAFVAKSGRGKSTLAAGFAVLAIAFWQTMGWSSNRLTESIGRCRVIRRSGCGRTATRGCCAMSPKVAGAGLHLESPVSRRDKTYTLR